MLTEAFGRAQKKWNPFPLLRIEDELTALVEAAHLALARHDDPSPRQAGKIRLMLQERLDALTQRLRQEAGDGE